MSLTPLNNAAAVAYGQGSPGRPASLAGTVQLLGMTSDELTQALRSGATLSSLAQARGVSSEDLRSSVQADLRGDTPRTVMSDAELIATATRLIDGHGAGAGAAQSQAGLSDREMIAMATRLAAGEESQATAVTQTSISSVSAVSSATALSNLGQLASAAGLDPAEVLARISSGQGLSGLLGQKGAGGYGSSLADSINGGIVIDEYA